MCELGMIPPWECEELLAGCFHLPPPEPFPIPEMR
jgi:hypothetical protein